MSERLTPEQIASTYKGGVRALRRLEQHGYAIVHPDDVPEVSSFAWDDHAEGWNDCRARIFGDDR